MPGHMIEQMKPKAASTADQIVDSSVGSLRCRAQIANSIEELHSLSRRGLWGMLLFLSLSAAALYLSQSGAFAMVPAGIQEMFGPPPPADLLHAALAVSWLSAFVLILGRRGADGRPRYNWYNIGLPAAFYPLYIFSDSAGTHFVAVFAAGLVLLLVEHVTVLCYVSKAVREEKERLAHLPQ